MIGFASTTALNGCPSMNWPPRDVCQVDGGGYAVTVTRFKDGSAFFARNGRYTFRLRCTENGDLPLELTQGRTSRPPTTDDVQRAYLAIESAMV